MFSFDIYLAFLLHEVFAKNEPKAITDRKTYEMSLKIYGQYIPFH
jgi:hypothetical protein